MILIRVDEIREVTGAQLPEPKQSHRHLSVQTCSSTSIDTGVAAKHTTCHNPKAGGVRGLIGNLIQVGEGWGREGMEDQYWPLVKCLVFHKQAASSYTLPEKPSLRRGFKEKHALPLVRLPQLMEIECRKNTY